MGPSEGAGALQPTAILEVLERDAILPRGQPADNHEAGDVKDRHQNAQADPNISVLTVHDAAAHIANPAVHSGGGTASGIVAALALASAELVVTLNRRRKSQQERGDYLDGLSSRLSELRARMLDHADRDARVLNELMGAYRVRKRGAQERQRYREQLINAAESGISLIIDISRFLQMITPESAHTPRFLVSDIGAAAALALGSHRAARLTTIANIIELRNEGMTDEAARIAKQLEEINEAIHDQAHSIYQQVESLLMGPDQNQVKGTL